MKIGKIKKLVANLHDKTEYVIHMRNLKQASNNGIVSKKLHKTIRYNQNPQLKPYIGMNTDLRKNVKKMIFKKIREFMNSAVFEKAMENMRKIKRY